MSKLVIHESMKKSIAHPVALSGTRSSTQAEVPDRYYNVQLMLSKLLRKGKLALCGTCMDACGMIEAEILEGVKRSTLNQLTDWTIEADKVLVF